MSETSKRSKTAPAKADRRAVKASSTQIVDLLSQRPAEVYRALGLEPTDANLSLPTDGRGARIRASVKQPKAESVPKSITLAVDDRRLTVPVEVDAEFQEFRPLGSQPAPALKATPRKPR